MTILNPSHRRTPRWICLGIAALTLSISVPVLAQDRGSVDKEEPYSLSSPSTRSTGTTSATVRAGQRQTRDQAKGIPPMSRINNRIPSRIQSRVYNRIDRIDPRASASSSIDAASERTRKPDSAGP